MKYYIARYLGLIMLAFITTSFAQSTTMKLYTTEGNPKAAGLRLELKYPSKWILSQGERPHIVQRFSLPDAPEIPFLVIIIKSLPQGTQINDSDVDEIFTQNSAQQLLPPNSNILEFKKTKIEQLPAAIVRYDSTLERAGNKIYVQAYVMMFHFEGKLVQLQFAVPGNQSDMTSVDKAMYSMLPLMQQIFSSVVLPDKWK